ncbi:MAG: hypothetical protein DMG82_11785 [Acidobacteria bacterium]|nr:MAG: hypothetical protein DMG82_11785 [Acidobacteriota bacterium]
MNPTSKALLALVPVCLLLTGAVILFSKRKTSGSLLQIVGAGCLLVVVLTHVCETTHLFPSMHWGEERSVGHYLDFASAAFGLTLFPAGYLLDALKRSRS